MKSQAGCHCLLVKFVPRYIRVCRSSSAVFASIEDRENEPLFAAEVVADQG